MFVKNKLKTDMTWHRRTDWGSTPPPPGEYLLHQVPHTRRSFLGDENQASNIVRYLSKCLKTLQQYLKTF